MTPFPAVCLSISSAQSEKNDTAARSIAKRRVLRQLATLSACYDGSIVSSRPMFSAPASESDRLHCPSDPIRRRARRLTLTMSLRPAIPSIRIEHLLVRRRSRMHLLEHRVRVRAGGERRRLLLVGVAVRVRGGAAHEQRGRGGAPLGEQRGVVHELGGGRGAFASEGASAEEDACEDEREEDERADHPAGDRACVVLVRGGEVGLRGAGDG